MMQCLIEYSFTYSKMKIACGGFSRKICKVTVRCWLERALGRLGVTLAGSVRYMR